MDQHPVGYGKLAAFEGCDPDLLIYRKFTWLRNCSLLYLQDELVELEEDLIALNKYEFVKEPRRLFSRRQNEGPDEIERRELLAKIQAKLIEYGELTRREHRAHSDLLDESLFRMQKIQAMKRPTKRNQSSVSAFIANTGSQAAEESDWIRLSPDLAAVAHDQEHGWLIAFLENTLLKISRKITIVCRLSLRLYCSFSASFLQPQPCPPNYTFIELKSHCITPGSLLLGVPSMKYDISDGFSFRCTHLSRIHSTRVLFRYLHHKSTSIHLG